MFHAAGLRSEKPRDRDRVGSARWGDAPSRGEQRWGSLRGSSPEPDLGGGEARTPAVPHECLPSPVPCARQLSSFPLPILSASSTFITEINCSIDNECTDCQSPL